MSQEETRRGFASMTSEERKKVQSLGGSKADNRFKWTPEQAKEASRKGLEKRKANKLAKADEDNL